MTETKSKRGGWRPNSGRPRTKMQTPLDYLISIFNDPTLPALRRDKAAQLALPYMHSVARQPSLRPVGMKEERQQRAEAASAEGLYAIPAAPQTQNGRPTLVKASDAEVAHRWLEGERDG